MSTSNSLDIKIIYPLSSQPRSAPRPTRAVAKSAQPKGNLLLGVINFVAASLLYFAVWWQVDPFIYRTLIMKTPIPGVDLSKVSAMIRSAPGESAAVETAETLAPRIGGMAAGFTMGSVAYGWLILATTATLALAIASGAALGRKLDDSWRRKWVILAGGGGLIFLWIVYDTATRFGWKFPPDHLRWSMGGVTLLAVVIGLVISANVRKLSRLAAFLLMLSALGSAVGMYLWGQCGALEGSHKSWFFIFIVFVAHSLYGWLLWPLAGRWAR